MTECIGCPVKAAIKDIYTGSYQPDDQYISVGGREYALDDTSYTTNLLFMEFARFRLAKPDLAAVRKFYLRVLANAGINRYDYINRVLFGENAPRLVKLLDIELAQLYGRIDDIYNKICSGAITTCVLGPMPAKYSTEELVKIPALLYQLTNEFIDFSNKLMINGNRPEYVERLASADDMNFGITNDPAPKFDNLATVDDYMNAIAGLMDFIITTGRFLTLLENFHRQVHKKLSALLIIK